MLPAGDKDGSAALEIRAGKMTYSNGIVSPEPHKGRLTFTVLSGSDVGVEWAPREPESSAAPISARWKRGHVQVSFVEKCTTGRVLLFKVTDNGKEELHFFWLQDKSDANDAKHLAVLKGTFAPLAGVEMVKLEDLKKIIASISNNNNSGAEISIRDLVSSNKVAEAVRAELDFYKARLQDTLPSELASSGNILDQIKNPQVTHAAAVLEAGLRDPQTCKELCKMYGLPESSVGVAGFLNAIIEQAKKAQ